VFPPVGNVRQTFTRVGKREHTRRNNTKITKYTKYKIKTHNKKTNIKGIFKKDVSPVIIK
jgi:hypothetical protein